ncbi:low molecular weight protein-tyrosine-phosphatase [Trueperella pyogenes]|uniref:low molecular weight protein-tyrosine-phosphatase n=1 Tax=Trueperella pyogenes TaxID=1661 RepID=UPI0032459B82
MYHVLVVCTGNICRSPMGEIVLRDRLAQEGIDDVVVSSAGVSAEESGNPIDRRAARVLCEHGHELPRHDAHRATDDELRVADLILAMTTGHARALRPMLARLGQPLEKVHLWREFDGTTDVASGGVFGPGVCSRRTRLDAHSLPTSTSLAAATMFPIPGTARKRAFTKPMMWWTAALAASSLFLKPPASA